MAYYIVSGVLGDISINSPEGMVPIGYNVNPYGTIVPYYGILPTYTTDELWNTQENPIETTPKDVIILTGPTYPTPEATKQALTETYGIPYEDVLAGTPLWEEVYILPEGVYKVTEEEIASGKYELQPEEATITYDGSLMGTTTPFNVEQYLPYIILGVVALMVIK